jgi:hypothetical protein
MVVVQRVAMGFFLKTKSNGSKFALYSHIHGSIYLKRILVLITLKMKVVDLDLEYEGK